MKRNFIRIFSLFVSVMLIFVMALPAFAGGLDYNDYVSNVMVDGDNDLVTVSFPTSYAGWVAYENLTDKVGEGAGEIQWFSFSTYNQWQIFCNFPTSRIDVSNIPNGTRVGFGVDLVIQRTTYMPTNQSFEEEVNIVYLLKDGTTTSQSLGSVTKTRYQYEFTYEISLTTTDFPLEIPNNADSMYLEIKIRSHAGNVGSWTCKCTAQYFDMEMKISSLYRQQQLTGKTNKLLDEVNRQLEEQGRTMNDILNGTPEQNESANNSAGILGDKGDQLGDLADSIQPDKPDLDGVNTNVGDLVPSTGLSALSSAISPIANNDLVIKVLVMVATLILVSYVLFGKRG